MKQVILPELEYVLFNELSNRPDGATGYDLRKFIASIYSKWSHQQVYRSLKRFTGELWTFTLVPQEGKPDKKVYRINVADDIEVISNPQEYNTDTLLLINKQSDILSKVDALNAELKAEHELLNQDGEKKLDERAALVVLYRINRIEFDINTLISK